MDVSAIIGTSFQVVAFLLAVWFYPCYKKTTEKIFVFFLGYTLLTELVGLYTAYVLKVNFTINHNVFIIVSFLVYFYWFYKILISKQQKKLVVVLSGVFLIVGIYNFVTQKHTNFHAITFIIGALGNIITSLLFFTQLLNDKLQIEVKHNLKFWIATGLLLFNVGMVPLMVFSEEFNAYNKLRIAILVVLNIILYTCYSLGFILCKKPTEKKFL